ncbi:hypothetical protein D3C74_455210 [compost metagenome]
MWILIQNLARMSEHDAFHGMNDFPLNLAGVPAKMLLKCLPDMHTNDTGGIKCTHAILQNHTQMLAPLTPHLRF